MRFTILSMLIFLLSMFAFADKSTANGTSGQADIQAETPQDTISRVAPDFSEKDIFDIHTISLKNYQGKVVLLNFWGPWCPPCRAEVPDLEKLQNTFKSKLVIIGAAVFSSSVAVEQFYKDYRMNYPVISGSFELMEKYGKISAFPTTIVINKKGVITAVVVGSRSRDQYEKMLKPLLAE